MAVCVRILITTATLLLVGNFLYSRHNTYTHTYTPRHEVVELHGNAAAAAAEQRRRQTSAVEQLGSSPSVNDRRVSPALDGPQQVTPATAAASAAAVIEVHMPPPPPPPRVVEVVPLAERVEVPEGESLPDELRAMRKGVDLFISFSSANMAPFALNWVGHPSR